MAVSLGPWIEPTIVLLASAFFALLRQSLEKKIVNLVLVTAGASIGGILAVGCGFAFPTLYFLNPILFNSWLASPCYFIPLLSALAFISGATGLIIANYYEYQLLVVDDLAFPIGKMAYKLITVQENIQQAVTLCTSFIATLVYSITFSLFSFSKFFTLFRGCTFSWCVVPPIRLILLELPMLWSIGFVTGHVIAVPMLIGIVTKIVICMPAYNKFFFHLKQDEFFLAFCSGLIFYGCILGFLSLRKNLWPWFKATIQSFKHCSFLMQAEKLLAHVKSFGGQSKITSYGLVPFVVICAFVGLLSYFDFSISSQIYLFILTVICTHQLLLIGGKVGIAPMPRFATFVMVPGILLFGFTGIQATIVSVLIEICGGVAVDCMFGRKMAQLARVDRATVVKYQWLGLLISSISLGIVFWLLINHFGLGSDQLFAQRAQTRALLISVSSFDFFAMLLGALYAAFLKEFKVNATLVLGGILMPFDYALLLTLGGLSSYLVHDKEAQYPFWSGMFAASSLWMIIRALL